MRWRNVPECFLPELLRGKPINRLVKDKVEFCYETFIDEGKDAASTSYNILDESRTSILAFMGLAIVTLVLLIIIVTITLCLRQRTNYNARDEAKEGKSIIEVEAEQLKIIIHSSQQREKHRRVADNQQRYHVQDSAAGSRHCVH